MTEARYPNKTIGQMLAENMSVCVFLLLATGLVMVMNATTAKGELEQTISLHTAKQFTWDLLGLICFLFIIFQIKITWFKRAAPWLGVLSLALLLAVFVFGTEINGARRWFKVGMISFQPSEMAKIFYVLFYAWFLELKKHDLHRLKGLFWPMVMLLSPVVLIAIEPDFGNAVLLMSVLLAMLFIAGARFWHLFSLCLLMVPVAAVALYQRFDHIRDRIEIFLNPGLDPMGKGYQSNQALIALGSGGFEGKGLGNGMQKFFYLPEAHNDFIFAIIGEDFGFMGCAAILGIYMLFVWYAMQACLRTNNLFSLLVCFGFTFIISGQAIFNMGVVTGLFPNKGISLPLISYGGSNVLFTMVALGILINFTRTLPPDRPKALGALRQVRRRTALF